MNSLVSAKAAFEHVEGMEALFQGINCSTSRCREWLGLNVL